MKKILLILLICVALCGCTAPESVESKEKNNIESTLDYESVEYKEKSEAYKKGEELGEELIDKMEGIDWDDTYEKAGEAGKEAAEFLNQLLGGE